MKVFIDGKAGTTGLRIEARLQGRSDVEILALPEAERKDPERRRWALNHCDAAILCLPDQAAIEAADMVENDHVILLDASTAHRTRPGWDYGFPERTPAHRGAVADSHRIAVPGCHASGFIALIYPLVQAGILPRSALLSCFSITGYSGGGKSMIAQYENDELDLELQSPRQYGLGQTHKHLPEMQKLTGLEVTPMFSPVVSNFPCGLVVTVPVFRQQLASGAGAADIRAAYRAAYQGPVVRYVEDLPESGFFASNTLEGRDCMEIAVGGNEERILLIANYDNLGKGASGAAIQCLNIACGVDETTGLVL